jgi:8-oxo-dGTP pyrophosphatase MutT (NUDIX family)
MMRDIRYQAAILHEHQILLIQHREHTSGRSYWLLPGGGSEAGETAESCVQREVREETGLEVKVGKLVLDEPAPAGDVYQRMHTYHCELLGGEAHPGYEPEEEAVALYGITEVGWFDLRDPAAWNELIQRDPITFPLLQRLRLVLGYTEEQAPNA